jgi:hypothetical protein
MPAGSPSTRQRLSDGCAPTAQAVSRSNRRNVCRDPGRCIRLVAPTDGRSPRRPARSSSRQQRARSPTGRVREHPPRPNRGSARPRDGRLDDLRSKTLGIVAEVAHERVAEDQDLIGDAAAPKEAPTAHRVADVLAVCVVLGSAVRDHDRGPRLLCSAWRVLPAQTRSRRRTPSIAPTPKALPSAQAARTSPVGLLSS